MKSSLVPVEGLAEEPYVQVLCYPSPRREEALSRLLELRELGVRSVIFEGKTKIGSLNVIGKGCVSMVVKALFNGSLSALKIRRVDANRPSMEREAELLRLANELGVGPKLLKASKNFLVIELIEGVRVAEWIKGLKGKGAGKSLRRVLKEVLDQCYALDKGGLDHGELSNLDKHLLIAQRPYIVDLETASTYRKVKNLSSAVQYLLIGGPMARKVRRMVQIKDVGVMIEAVREYKALKTKGSYHSLLERLGLL